MMYDEADYQAAGRMVKVRRMLLLAVLGVMLMLYAAAAIFTTQGVMLAVLLAAFAFAVFYGDLYLLPAVRYQRFLNQIKEGLRRETDGTILDLNREEQTQDGARVYTLRIRLADDSDERLYWVNVGKTGLVPESGARVHMESSGRHVTAIERIAA